MTLKNGMEERWNKSLPVRFGVWMVLKREATLEKRELNDKICLRWNIKEVFLDHEQDINKWATFR